MELTDYIQYVVALVFVLALIGILFWMMKKFRGSSLANGAGGKRLNIIEGAVIDSKRRLVLIKRDNVEHLLLLGPTHDLVVEAGIGVKPAIPTQQRKPAPSPQTKAPPPPNSPEVKGDPESAAENKKSGALNWKLSAKEHVEPPAPKKKAAPKAQSKAADIRPGEQK